MSEAVIVTGTISGRKARMRAVICLHLGMECGSPISAVQDTFGKQFRRILNARLEPGDIFAGKVVGAPNAKYPITEDGVLKQPVRIIAKVHQNTVRAALRAAGLDGAAIAPGSWYEVHCD